MKWNLLILLSCTCVSVFTLHLRYAPNEINKAIKDKTPTSHLIKKLTLAKNYTDFVNALKKGFEATDNDNSFLNSLRAEFAKGSGKQKLVCEYETINVKDLVSTQSQIALSGSLEWIFSSKGKYTDYFGDSVTPGGRIVTYNHRYVIDGHHRWSQTYMLNPDAKINTVDCHDVPEDGDRPLATLRKFQAAVSAIVGCVPSSEVKDDNVYDMEPEKIKENLEKFISNSINKDSSQSVTNRIIADINKKKGNVIHQGEKKKTELIDYLMKNVQNFKSNSLRLPKAGPREEMPQTDSPTKTEKKENGKYVIHKFNNEKPENIPLDLKDNNVIHGSDNQIMAVINLMNNTEISLGFDINDELPEKYKQHTPKNN